ncbi:MAG: c-type cytochrome [Flavipsychrobacter sp.]|nr:c-type cytochrome [Flavipsychrobacter sp.]
MRKYNKVFLATTISLLPAAVVLAAETAGTDKSPVYNMTLVSMVSLMLILLFIIGMLAYTMKQLGYVVREKVRKDKSTNGKGVKSVLALVGFTLLGISAYAQEDAAAATNELAHTSLPEVIAGIPATEFYVLTVVLCLELVVIFLLSTFIHMLLKTIRQVPEAEEALLAKKSWFWDNFNKAVAIEKEKDIMLDHDYDGIHELDNSLPPWWLYGFYLTIFVGVIYIYRYHFSGDGMSQEEEYVAEMQKGEEDKAAYLAKSANNVDENTVVYLSEAADLAAGKEIYVQACAACHLADGGGTVGPNLTDDYWLHGGSVKDIFKSIKYGWQEKGMKSWKDDYSPKQIQQLTSFVKSLKGTKPAVAKAPQGDLYIEAGAASSAAAVTDTTKK